VLQLFDVVVMDGFAFHDAVRKNVKKQTVSFLSTRAGANAAKYSVWVLRPLLASSSASVASSSLPDPSVAASYRSLSLQTTPALQRPSDAALSTILTAQDLQSRLGVLSDWLFEQAQSRTVRKLADQEIEFR
jgi:hypothetical protein